MMRSTLRRLMGWPCLAQLLGNDLCGSFGIQETMPDGQPDYGLGAAVIGLGAALFQSQAQSAPGLEGLEQLIIALAAEVELPGGLGGAAALALADHEHGQAAGDLVVITDGQDATGTGEAQMLCKE
jgi:hypothetical protein